MKTAIESATAHPVKMVKWPTAYVMAMTKLAIRTAKRTMWNGGSKRAWLLKLCGVDLLICFPHFRSEMANRIRDGHDQVGDQNGEKNHVEWRIEACVALETLWGRFTHLFPSFPFGLNWLFRSRMLWQRHRLHLRGTEIPRCSDFARHGMGLSIELGMNIYALGIHGRKPLR